MATMSAEQRQREEARDKGRRAEDVAQWYFRLNGFLSIPGFVVHLDKSRAHIALDGTPRFARTEADLMGVRFVGSRERIFAETYGGRDMVDDPKLTKLATGLDMQALFVLVEVKAGLCKMNGPWTSSESNNMQRVIRRLGFARDEDEVEVIAKAMYASGRYQDDFYTLQYICIGADKNAELQANFPNVVQIEWCDIGRFLARRFSDFPEKLPDGHVHEQWPDFGKKFGQWFRPNRYQANVHTIAAQAVERYVRDGVLELNANAGRL